MLETAYSIQQELTISTLANISMVTEHRNKINTNRATVDNVVLTHGRDRPISRDSFTSISHSPPLLESSLIKRAHVWSLSDKI
jgi:hypothetical protein